MKKRIIGIIAAVFIIAASGFIFLLISQQTHENRPYDPGTPAPEPHSGLFVSGYGTMEFSGDGKSIVIDFSPELAELTGLPEGRSEGTYDFLSGDLPPHGSVPVRYDTAHEMRIAVGDAAAVIDMGTASEDGKTGHTGVNTVTPETIPMLFRNDSGFFEVTFTKQPQ